MRPVRSRPPFCLKDPSEICNAPSFFNITFKVKSRSEKQREFVSLIIKHQPNIRAFIISLMPGIDGASDVLQEVNMVLWEKMKSFELGTNFQAWAFTIARFEVKSHLRRLHRQQLPDSVAQKLAIQFDESYVVDPEKADSRVAALRECMARLSEADRSLVEARYSGDDNLKEFSTLVDVPLGTLRVNLHRVRNALRNCISERLKLRSIHSHETP